MQIIGIIETGSDYEYTWPDSSIEVYPSWIKYLTRAEDGDHEVTITFGTRDVYGKERIRILVLIDGYPHAEFFGADDIEYSGEVLSEIKLKGEVGEPMCRYPEDPIPERYGMFRTAGLPTRVEAKGIHNAWVVVANIADHEAMITLAAMRRVERER